MKKTFETRGFQAGEVWLGWPQRWLRSERRHWVMITQFKATSVKLLCHAPLCVTCRRWLCNGTSTAPASVISSSVSQQFPRVHHCDPHHLWQLHSAPIEKLMYQTTWLSCTDVMGKHLKGDLWTRRQETPPASTTAANRAGLQTEPLFLLAFNIPHIPHCQYLMTTVRGRKSENHR